MIGVYYYPEQWPEEQWERDIARIRELGMKHIHLAEFSWIHLQPEKHRFEFGWLDRAVELSVKYGLKIVLCTPTATPPIWMAKDHPDILMVKQTQTRVTHGSRAHRCVNSETFRAFSNRITAKLAKRYGHHKNVIGWQIDNELGHYGNEACYCDSCHTLFTQYLRDKYASIDALNRAWGGDFWSQNYQRFTQVELPNPYSLPYLPNEHALLDFKRFYSLSLSRYIEDQSEVLREHIDPAMWITHNFMKDDPHHFPAHVSKGLDMYTLTIYPVAGQFTGEKGRELHRLGNPYNIGLNHERMRSYNGCWGIMEQQPGQVNWGPHNMRPYPGSTRLWLWTAIAHGAEFLDTYRYRQPRCGCEQYHDGIVTLDGTSLSAGGRDFVQTAEEMKLLADYLAPDNSANTAASFDNIALILDWDSLTALTIHPQTEQFSSWDIVEYYYRGFKSMGLGVDIITPDRIDEVFSYKMACVVLTDLVSDSLPATLANYTQQGGHLILSARNFSRLENGHFPETAYCRRLEVLTGCTFNGYDVMVPGHEGTIDLCFNQAKLSWNIWAEQVTPPPGAELCAIHGDQFYKGECAAFSAGKGEGRVSYIGFIDKQGIADTLEYLIGKTYPHRQRLPDNCLAVQRGLLTFFLNYNDRPVQLPGHLLKSSTLLLGEQETPPAGVAILRHNDASA